MDFYKKQPERSNDYNNVLLRKMDEAMELTHKIICKNLSTQVYSDNALHNMYKPEPQTIWRRIKNKLRMIKERASNAWDALKGDLDYN